MIKMLDTRILTAVIGLGIGTIIEFFISIIVYQKDPHFRANQFMACGYLALSCGLCTNLIYVLIGGNSLLDMYAHRIANLFAIITGIALYTAVIYLIKGAFGLQELWYKIFILAGGIFGLLTLVSPGIIILANPIPDINQFIVWDYLYTFFAITPVIFYGILIVIQLLVLLATITTEYDSIKKPIKVSIFSFILLIVSYLLLVVPHILYYIFNNPDLLVNLNLVGNIGALGFLIASILIAYSFLSGRSKSKETNSTISSI